MTPTMKKLYFFVFGFFFLSLAPTLVHAASDNFVPLTSFGPALEFAKSDSLPAFFNALYKICIGVAATLAVLQIMRAGIMYMGGDSVTETKQAREIIQNAVLGLVLVLAPAIIFSIINPDILNLKIGFDKLTPSSVTTSSVESSTNNPTGATNVIPGAGLPCTIPGTTGNTGFTEPGKGCIARAQANVGDVKYT
jgi:type IV secretory pathway VirB2 component (pilin)